MRIVMQVEYNGTNYHGFQHQSNNLPTIARTLECAISKVANHKVNIVCAGRTDKGVHACAQVIHFDSCAKRTLRAWQLGTNSNLARDISVINTQFVSDDFHARFSALERRYRYVIYQNDIRPALMAEQVTWQSCALNITNMQIASSYLIGEYDFSSLRGADCQAKSPVRTIYELKIMQQGKLLIIEVCANAFLHHMVRNIAGLLMEVGKGTKPIEFVQYVLNSKHRDHQFITAAPNGLYLVDVRYPSEFGIKSIANTPYFLEL